jgi:hypothetical protein
MIGYGFGFGTGRNFAARKRRVAAPTTPAALITAVNAGGWSAEWADTPPEFTAASPKTIAVVRPGFNASGVAVSHTDSRVFTQRLRQVYPNQATYAPLSVVMDDYVYATDSIVGATNNSIFVSPKPIAAWVMPSRLLVGNSIDWEIIAFHRNARRGYQVACVRVRATDGTKTTAWRTVAQTALSTMVEDAQPVEVYKGTVDITELAEGLVWLEAEVVPWIGTVATILKSNDQTAEREFSRRYFTKNVARAAAPALVYVSPTGSNTTGVCSTDPAIAKAKPFADVQGAITGALAATALTGGRVDGVVVRIMAGTNVWGTFNSATNRTQTSAALIIERDPDSTRAACILVQSAAATLKLGYSTSTTTSLASPLTEAAIVIRYLTYQRSAAGALGNGGTVVGLHIQLWNVVWDNGNLLGAWNGSTGGLSLFGFVITNQASFFTYSPTVEQRMMRGVVATMISTYPGNEEWVKVGCKLTGWAVGTNRNAVKGSITFNCKYLNPYAPSAVLNATIASDTDTIVGVVFVQNLVETTHTTSSTAVFGICQNRGNSYHTIIAHNVFTGFGQLGRQNLFYSGFGNGGINQNHDLVVMIGNIFSQLNFKSATYSSNPALIGPRAVENGVGCYGNWSQFGANTMTERQIYPGLGSNLGTVPTTRNDPLFVNYQGTTGTTTPTYIAGAGGGDYHLQSASLARGIVAANVLSYDLEGVVRAATGAQSAGAYA